MTGQAYFADLAAYSAGVLHGAWIDVTQRADEIRDEIEAMPASSPVPGAEEYAVHDYDGLPSSVGEWLDLDQLAAIAEGIE
jgi:antirestriction protein